MVRSQAETAILTVFVATFAYGATYAFSTACELVFRRMAPSLVIGSLAYFLTFGAIMSALGIALALYSGLLSVLAGDPQESQR
jgi:hypothetical protein